MQKDSLEVGLPILFSSQTTFSSTFTDSELQNQKTRNMYHYIILCSVSVVWSFIRKIKYLFTCRHIICNYPRRLVVCEKNGIRNDTSFCEIGWMNEHRENTKVKKFSNNKKILSPGCQNVYEDINIKTFILWRFISRQSVN